jgi:heme exporter protein A
MLHPPHQGSLRAEQLTLWRGTRCLFEQLSFEVNPGTVMLVQGPNGSGKTTLLRILCGLTRAESGRVFWAGQVIGSEYWGELAYNGHLPGLKADLTVGQNLDFFAATRGLGAGQWRESAADLGLSRCEDLEVRHLSAGQKRRAALVRLLLSGAKVWILDEPFTNLDQQGRALIERAIDKHVADGGLAIVAAHHALHVDSTRLRRLTLGAPN